MNSENNRLGKKIVLAQKEIVGENWTTETERIGRKYGMEMEEVDKVKKSEWKKELKKRIASEIENVWKDRCVKMKKLRHGKKSKFGKKDYLTKSSTEEASEYLCIRLEMKDIGNNQGKERKCMCGEKESVEHLSECKEIRDKIGIPLNIEDIKAEEKWRLEKARKCIRRYLKIREQGVKEVKDEEQK